MNQRTSSLHLDNLDEVLTASKNGAQKGQQQYETPLEYAEAFSYPLPRCRPVVLDPQCGSGTLLKGAAKNEDTQLLGIDIDPRSRSRGIKTIINNVCDIYRLFKAVDAQFDLIVANPPFGLKWPRNGLPQPPAPKAEFGKSKRRVVTSELDSTYATWLMINDLLSSHGEGYLICNDATARRLIAPCALSKRIWLWVTLPNFFTKVSSDMRVAVIYFAANHKSPPFTGMREVNLDRSDITHVRAEFEKLAYRRKQWRRGESLDYGYMKHPETITKWEVVRNEWKRLKQAADGKRDYNIWLSGGRIRCYLTPFQRVSGEVPQELAEELNKLRDKSPMELVVLKDTRTALMEAIQSNVWRVDPNLKDVVEQAVREYHHARVPFSKPMLAQRIGWLDEHDEIECAQDWECFKAGGRYRMESETFESKKNEYRYHPTLGKEKVEIKGQELALIIYGPSGCHVFTQHPVETIPDSVGSFSQLARAKWHLLGDLTRNFIVPEVPDIAESDPTLYREMRKRVLALEC